MRHTYTYYFIKYLSILLSAVPQWHLLMDMKYLVKKMGQKCLLAQFVTGPLHLNNVFSVIFVVNIKVSA